ncbi:MAG TPA: Coenzyme F420 hydrogenase/dehydrogenase, beta subunit C-terminal domain [Thermomicrobiaceae bacterium]|nr:Coenzyme F420 hydrogenase/dehydrogenase, beta subunit C-terminal domain [Thermomicrobiaceae bacterium]
MAGFAIREAMSDIAEAPGKTWFWDLEKAVIDASRCIQCGACIAACPSDSIGIGADDLPKLVKMCTGCSLCWDFCPRGGLRAEATWTITGRGAPRQPGLGVVQAQYTARANPPVPGAQDGGVVSAILIALLEAGELDGVLLARPSRTEPWKGEAFLARTPEEVIASAGSFYNQTLALGHLDLKRYQLPPKPRIALVGTPCEIEGLKAMQARPWEWGASRVDAVVLTIGLLCTKSFNYEGLMLREIEARRGIPLDRIGKIDILHGKLYLYGHDGELLLEEQIRHFHGSALKGCDECADFLGHAADIAVGSVGSANGYSSILVRTAAGKRAIEQSRARLELHDLERPEALEKLDALDKKVAAGALKRPFDPEAPLFIDFAEHLQHYAGSDRAPVTHDAVRY